MCLQVSQVRPFQKWHWSGDEIVFQPIIPASRPMPAGRKKKTDYPIDIREFLSIRGNAVVRRALHRHFERLPVAEQARCFQDRAGNFDFRVDQVCQLVGGLKYLPAGRRFDAWQFPEETLARGGGDCEDLSFLMASLLEAAGISTACVRVALGQMQVHEHGRTTAHDHAWVVYQDEGGAWEILEPLTEIHRATGRRVSAGGTRTAADSARTIDYVPHFVFNSEHLWRVRNPDRATAQPFKHYLGERRFWRNYNPQFAAKVHNTIFDEALPGMPPGDLRSVKCASLWLDVNVLAYDPRDHFDFAYVAEGWRRVKTRLATGTLHDFALAAHAIADFYAHTVYGEFGPVRAGRLVPYDPEAPDVVPPPVYDFQSCSLPGCQLTPADAAAHWQGQIISGQWWRWYATFPDDLQKTADFKRFRRCLPDHDRVAVDSSKYPGAPHRYGAAEYLRQYQLRKDAAVAHLRAAYNDWKKGRC